ncbi:MAG: hypothetical protein ACFBSE_27465, partial [Prochloraceae cyanobacterium]
AIASISIASLLLSVILYNINFSIFTSSALWLPLIPPLLGIPIAAVSYIAAISLLDRQRYSEEMDSFLREQIEKIEDPNYQDNISRQIRSD